MQSSQRKAGKTSPLDLVVRTVCQPVAMVSSQTYRAISGFFSGAVQGDKFALENERLRRQLDALSLYDDRIKDLEFQVDSLRQLADLAKSYDRPKVMADVIYYSAIEDRVTIAAGKNKGIEPGMVVVCAAGLVGRVQTVAPSECQALLLTANTFQIGATALGYNPAPYGLIRGDDTETLILGFQSEQPPVKSGDIVVTSGFSDKLPRGIPRGIVIGRVLSTETRPEVGASRAIVLPKVNPGNLREVVILK
ncbi:MAG: rod shape-determining protein MreC [Fimbriimonas sp.]|nr:rod shape-determining protein MreC [Fimbriimonas sp.]